jgi:hypothetical protein
MKLRILDCAQRLDDAFFGDVFHKFSSSSKTIDV